jgi:predicted nucleotide-binding protein
MLKCVLSDIADTSRNISTKFSLESLSVFYHVQIESTSPSRRDDATVATDKDTDWIERYIVTPHRIGERIFVSGRTFTWDEIDRITIAATSEPADTYITDGLYQLWVRSEDVTERFITGPPGEIPFAENPDRVSFAADRKAVMVIYGHDYEANVALFDWLRRLGLRPKEWNQLVHASGSASPYVGDVLVQAFKDAQAVIAFFTPDERVQARTAAPASAGTWRFQARPNVLIEAGMALITHPSRTVLVALGDQELPSDLAGRLYIRLSPTSTEALNALATRLRDAGCEIDQTGDHWLDPSGFPDRDNLPKSDNLPKGIE